MAADLFFSSFKGTIPPWKTFFFIRGECIPKDKFDATDYDSAFRFSENFLVFEKISFELLYNYLLRVISNTFALLPNFAAFIATVIQLRIMLGHEQTFHSSFAHKQVPTPEAHAAEACDVAHDHIMELISLMRTI